MNSFSAGKGGGHFCLKWEHIWCVCYVLNILEFEEKKLPWYLSGWQPSLILRTVQERSHFLVNVDFPSHFHRHFVLKSCAVIFDSGGASRSPTWQIKQGCLFGNGSKMDLNQILSVVNISRCIGEAKGKCKKQGPQKALESMFYIKLSMFVCLIFSFLFAEKLNVIKCSMR